MDNSAKPFQADAVIELRKAGATVSRTRQLLGVSLAEIAAALEFFNCPDATARLSSAELERLDELDELALMAIQAEENCD